MRLNIPLAQPDITEAEIEAVVAVLRSSRLSLGPKMEEFEALVSNYIGVPHGIAVSSGTAGLHLCVRALGLGEGDEVILPSFTFIAAANAIRYERATPVFVDIDPTTLNVDPLRIEEAITPNTRAILVVHTFGRPADMTSVRDIAQRHKLLVIEDACEALGAEYRGLKVGSLADAAVFAFYPNKQITTGEGGMVVTRDSQLARHIRALRNQGRYETDDWLQHSLLGYNYRLSEINCALGCVQMQRLEPMLAQRKRVARNYHEHLLQDARFVLPVQQVSGARMSWFVYIVRLADRYIQSHRDVLAHQLNSHGIGCGRYFAPIHMQKAYIGAPVRHALPVTEAISARTLALPFFNRLTESEVQYVCHQLAHHLDKI